MAKDFRVSFVILARMLKIKYSPMLTRYVWLTMNACNINGLATQPEQGQNMAWVLLTPIVKVVS